MLETRMAHPFLLPLKLLQKQKRRSKRCSTPSGKGLR
jgi:hypothetical protein